MTEHWATIGLDLHLEVTGTRLRAGLESALRQAVRSGRLPAGMKLPSSRALSQDLGIARNTVADAYGQLTAEGWLATRHGAGTWAAERTAGAPTAAEPVPGPARRSRYDLRARPPDV